MAKTDTENKIDTLQVVSSDPNELNNQFDLGKEGQATDKRIYFTNEPDPKSGISLIQNNIIGIPAHTNNYILTLTVYGTQHAASGDVDCIMYIGNNAQPRVKRPTTFKDPMIFDWTLASSNAASQVRFVFAHAANSPVGKLILNTARQCDLVIIEIIPAQAPAPPAHTPAKIAVGAKPPAPTPPPAAALVKAATSAKTHAPEKRQMMEKFGEDAHFDDDLVNTSFKVTADGKLLEYDTPSVVNDPQNTGATRRLGNTSLELNDEGMYQVRLSITLYMYDFTDLALKLYMTKSGDNGATLTQWGSEIIGKKVPSGENFLITFGSDMLYAEQGDYIQLIVKTVDPNDTNEYYPDLVSGSLRLRMTSIA